METISKQPSQTEINKVTSPTEELVKVESKVLGAPTTSAKRPGRPKGSKNKPKETKATPPEAVSEVVKQAEPLPEVKPVEVKPKVVLQGAAARYEALKNSGKVPTTMSQIFGEEAVDKYGTADPEEYHRKLCTMSRAEIFYHSSQMGIALSDNLVNLRKKLLGEFNKHLSFFNVPKTGTYSVGTVAKKPTKNLQNAKKTQEFKDLPEAVQTVLDSVK